MHGTTRHGKNIRGEYAAVFDPLDGSANIEAGLPCGTIFGILRVSGSAREGQKAGPSTIVLSGRRLVAAGYCLYGPSTKLVFTLGAGVFEFTLQGEGGHEGQDGEGRGGGGGGGVGLGGGGLEFVLTRSNMRIPRSGHVSSVGLRSVWWCASASVRVWSVARDCGGLLFDCLRDRDREGTSAREWLTYGLRSTGSENEMQRREEERQAVLWESWGSCERKRFRRCDMIFFGRARPGMDAFCSLPPGCLVAGGLGGSGAGVPPCQFVLLAALVTIHSPRRSMFALTPSPGCFGHASLPPIGRAGAGADLQRERG